MFLLDYFLALIITQRRERKKRVPSIKENVISQKKIEFGYEQVKYYFASEIFKVNRLSAFP